jgi:carboxyl-terminal processing protease
MMNQPPTNESSPKRLRYLFGALLVLLLCGTTAVLGYYLGQSNGSETAVVTQEVTREILVTATAEPTAEATAESVANLSDPVPAEPTAVPTASVVEAEPAPAQAEPELPAEFVPRQEDVTNIDFALFYEAWRVLIEEYDGQIPSNEELLFSAISGSMDTLGDEHTRFVNPETAQRIRENQGPVEGIGAIVTENDDKQIEIVRPIDGQPADLAGVKAGDVLIAVNGESVVGQSLDEVVLVVRGPSGTQVTITVQRPGVDEPIDFTITRARFEVPVVEATMLPEKIAYVRLTTFLDQTASIQVKDALEPLLAQEPVGIIFDLRDNGGGYLSEAINVGDLFMPEGIILLERNIRGLNETFGGDSGDIGETLPLVVLVNAGSASASEIVAGAIQDSGRGLILGETTFGKGSVQQVHTLSNGAELRVTIARWFTPNNHSIDGAGITPDIVVETPADLGGDADTQLQQAIEYLLTETNQ